MKLQYFHGLYAVVVVELLPDSAAVRCRALYPKRDRLPIQDFITDADGLTDTPRWVR